MEKRKSVTAHHDFVEGRTCKSRSVTEKHGREGRCLCVDLLLSVILLNITLWNLPASLFLMEETAFGKFWRLLDNEEGPSKTLQTATMVKL